MVMGLLIILDPSIPGSNQHTQSSEEYSEEKLWLFQEAPSKYGILSFLEANRSKDSCNSVWLKSSVTTTLGIKFKFSNLTNNNQ